MAQQKIIWTVLPHGRETAEGPHQGKWRVSIVVSPRLTPQAPEEQQLGSFPEWADWPATLKRVKFALEIGGTTVGLQPVAADLAPDLAPDSEVWRRLFYPRLPVAGFQFTDMSRVNLRSFPVRNVLGFVKRHYRNLSAQAGLDHPTLLPWKAADPSLKGLLTEAGTRTKKQDFGHVSLEFPLPGFDRFHEESRKGDGTRPHEQAVNARVFTGNSCIKAPARLPGPEGGQRVFPLRALPPDWEDPALIRSGAIAVDPADRERRAELMDQFSGPAEYALWQSERFYNRTVPTRDQRAMRRPGFVGGTAPVTPPQYDFHQRVASYADHPQLLRRLGLVIDCVLDNGDAIEALLGMAIPAQGFMRLRLSSEPPHNPFGDTFSTTAWWATQRRFVVRPRTDDHAAGLLKLERANDRHEPVHPREGSAFDVFQVDPDGAALKTVDFVLSAQRLLGKHLALGADGQVTYTTGDKQPVAALRSGGLGVSRHGRAGSVAMNAAAAALNHGRVNTGGAAAAQVTLFAEDVLRGYRVDVHDRDVGRWRSLVQREGRYTALPRKANEPPMDIPLPPDEGYVKGASTTSGDDKPDDHYLHETLFRWTGWSLAAPRPGRTLRDRTEPGTNMQVEEVVDVDDTASAGKGNGLAVKLAAARGTLPRLRFGHEYRVRARLVDLAGNSLALDDPDLADDEQASDPVTYGRFEPVDPPALVLRRRLSEGESLERLVLRSNFNRGTEAYAKDIAESPVLAPLYANADFAYGATAERHVVPPKASQQQCELHGMFDFAIGSGDPDAARKAYEIAARENGSLMHPHPNAKIELVTPARASAVATVGAPGEVILPPEQADATRDRFAAGQYLIHREKVVPVPYLSDPACGGIALLGVPGIEPLVAGLPLQLLAPGLLGVVIDKGLRAALLPSKERWVLLADFDIDPGDDPASDWPDDVRSLRLVLAEQPGEVDNPPCGPVHTAADAPKWDLEARTLTIFLPKGHIARLRYASFVHDRLIDHFGLPRWHDANGATRLRAEAMAGINWTMTPWRALTLVHATQQPVCLPQLQHVSVVRGVGDPHAVLNAREVLLHGPSTGKFEIVAEWHEWVDDPLADDPAQPGPKRVAHEAQLAEIRLSDNHRNLFTLQDAVAAQTHFTPVGGQVDPTALAQRPAVPGNRHEFGDTRFRFVRYHLRATTRFREYLPPALFADAARITRDGPVVERDRVNILARPELGAEHDAGAPVLRVATGGVAGLVVPSSAPPEVPELIYTVPTFRWDRPLPANGVLQSTRYGNGLRVYLDRPWFSSGDGELLGVVIRGEGTPFDGLAPEVLPYVTQWGRDPIWDSDPPSTRSRVSDFPAAVASGPVVLQELPGVPVHVVGHRVHFDAARKLWYCDIELNPGATYMPFVRLALVRYQPNALGSAMVSRVVLAEFAQVLPRRRAVMQRSTGAPAGAAGPTLTVKLHGPVPDRGPMRRFNPGGMEESPYADISYQPLPGQSHESGRNRVELVLQVRDAAIDSDLAWRDHAVLGDSTVGVDAATTGIGEGLQPRPSELRPEEGAAPAVRPADLSPVNVRTRQGRTLRFDRMVQRTDLPSFGEVPAALAPAAAAVEPSLTLEPGFLDLIGPAGPIGPIGPVLPPVVIDPPVWTLTVAMPTWPAGRPARLMLREWERFYTDRTVPEVRGGSTHRRVLVEERLVYAEVFALE